jgi:hypothetical protein
VLYKEVISVRCEIHAEHTTALYGQNVELLHVKRGGMYSKLYSSLEGIKKRNNVNKIFVIKADYKYVCFKVTDVSVCLCMYVCMYVNRFFFYTKTNQMHNISNLYYFGTTLYMFRTVFRPSSGV